jgi:hypothetical protein
LGLLFPLPLFPLLGDCPGYLSCSLITLLGDEFELSETAFILEG